MMSRNLEARTLTDDWNTQVITAPVPQLLPLLYVANDVLQNSRRSGTHFLESFSPILGEALTTMCLRCGDISLTEKIRRVVKIWGERR